ncbi:MULTISPECIES: M48 family metalloprotease [Sphingomonadales]|uniref:TPR repeat-containing protein YfgC n=1 Tax=Edaphosphingomonas haloaromaticamans TaxID=653954 RepID=A0A1S1H9Z7_9SPHN|nr:MULTISPECIES: M48 family metalloprotease [Sphingomonas]AGH50503.1 peptidase M48 Ste24p [Sphingomonas sp. MM-1]MDX3886121.1 M48 family metalloprotease [Sphingomonas sp.]OHT18937.1 TPR repeat-containing protein YfgC precursor [Sphingomonas haloaromaticamans]
MKRIVAWGVAASLLGYAGYGAAQQAQSISAADKKAGAAAHPQLLQEFGGAFPGATANYVTGVGRKIAVQSGLANSQSEFTITLLNSPVNNAFAIPGGYVYTTRALVGLMNDEAELASVLGHEVGHVAARHSAKRQEAQQRNSILGALLGLGLGAIAGDSGLGQLLQQGAGQAAQLMTLRYSRKQEYEADDLGIRYLYSAGYDTLASSTMLASLAAQTTLDARDQGGEARNLPEWASTHPDPAGRVVRARQKAQAMGGTGRIRNRDAFLNAVDGLLYGDDPHQGVVDGRTFRHPDLRIAFTVPQGFALSNGSDAVSISGSGGQAQFSGGKLGGSLAAYIDGVYRQLGGQGSVGNVQTTQINGVDTAYAVTRAQTKQGQVDVGVIAYSMGNGSAYHFVTIAPAGRGLGPFQPMVQSFSRLSPAQAAAIHPRRIDVVTVKAGDTVQSLSQRMAYDTLKQERFLTINGLDAGARLAPGQRVKLIVWG